MTIEEEVAQTIEDNVFLSPWDTERDRMVSAITTALTPLLNRVRAEALREAAKDFLVNTWLDVLKPAGGIPGLTRNAHGVADWLGDRADAIEQNSEGNET